MKSPALLSMLAILAVGSMAAHANVQNSITITELSSTQLRFDWDFGPVQNPTGPLSEIETTATPDFWVFDSTPFLQFSDGAGTLGWVEPDNNNRFNYVTVANTALPGGFARAQFIVSSDSIQVHQGAGTDLANNTTEFLTPGGSLTITFNDLGDSPAGVPDPASTAGLLAGCFGGLYALRRKLN